MWMLSWWWERSFLSCLKKFSSSIKLPFLSPCTPEIKWTLRPLLMSELQSSTTCKPVHSWSVNQMFRFSPGAVAALKSLLAFIICLTPRAKSVPLISSLSSLDCRAHSYWIWSIFACSSICKIFYFFSCYSCSSSYSRSYCIFWYFSLVSSTFALASASISIIRFFSLIFSSSLYASSSCALSCSISSISFYFLVKLSNLSWSMNFFSILIYVYNIKIYFSIIKLLDFTELK